MPPVVSVCLVLVVKPHRELMCQFHQPITRGVAFKVVIEAQNGIGDAPDGLKPLEMGRRLKNNSLANLGVSVFGCMGHGIADGPNGTAEGIFGTNVVKKPAVTPTALKRKRVE